MHINRQRIRKGEPRRIKFPYATKRWQVRNGQTLSVFDLETGVLTALCRSQPPVPRAPAPAPASAFVPGLAQTTVHPSELRLDAPAFTPCVPSVEPPPLDPTFPVFNPCQTPFQVPQLYASPVEFTPTHYMQPAVHMSTPLHPGDAPFFPGPTAPSTPTWISTSSTPYHFGPYASPCPPFLQPMAPFEPFRPLAQPIAPFESGSPSTNYPAVNWIPPIEEVIYPSSSTDTEVVIG